MKKLSILFLALVASVGTMFADPVQIGDLYYNLDGDKLTAEMTASPDKYSGSVVIPSSVTYNTATYSVTSIGVGAFYGCSGLTSVTIPNSVTSIGEAAFYQCTGLTSVTIPNSVTYIGNEVMGFGVFSGCTGLTSVTIGNSVTSIGSGAFYGCTGLTSVTIPNSVTSIGENAFSGCTGLTSIEIPNSVTSIGVGAFKNCTGLTSVTIGNSVTEIDGSIIDGCTNLETIKISANVAFRDSEYSRKWIGIFVYSEGVDGYRSCSFNNIKHIEAPSWVFNVPEPVWSYCPKNLQTIVINNGELNDNAFGVISRSYRTLEQLDIVAVTNTSLADEAFKGCYSMTSLVLPENLENLGYMTVADCKSLQGIDIPASVREIDNSAFENCRSLKTITFGGSANPAPGRHNAPMASASQLERIGNWAFYNCHELQNLEIPEGVTEIGDGAFYGCVYLENLTLPSSVQAIGDNAFALCSKLNRMDVDAIMPPSAETKTFYEVSRTAPVYVPDESVDLYKNDPIWDELNIVGKSQVPQAIDQVDSSSLQGGDRGRLILRDGQILILRGDKIYTLQGAEVK